MKTLRSLLISALLSNAVLSATAQEDDTPHLGHDYPRQQLHTAAKLSSKDIEQKSLAVLAAIKARIHPDDEGNHYTEMAAQFDVEQELWRQYRDSTCLLQAYTYVYPSSSRMFFSQQDACIHEMNDERLRYLDDLLQNL